MIFGKEIWIKSGFGKLILLIFIFLLDVLPVLAQFSYKIEGVVKENEKGLGGVILTLSNDESGQEKVATTNSSGSFSFSLKPNEEYSLTATRTGYVKVKLLYSTIGFSDEEEKDFKGVSKPEIELFKLPADTILAAKMNEAFESPLMSYFYSSGKTELTSDDDISSSMRLEFLKYQKMADQLNNNGALTESKYKAAISKGDKALVGKNYDQAKAGYSEALVIKPEDALAKSKLADVSKAMLDEAEKEKLSNEKAMAESAEKDRLAKEKAIADAAALAEKQRIAAAYEAEKKRLAQQKAEADAADLAEKQRIAAAEKAEADRLAKEKAAATAADLAEKQRIAAAEKAEAERLAKEKADATAAELAEKQRIAAVEKAETDRIAKEKADAIATELAEKQRIAAAEKAETLRIANEKAAAEALEREKIAKEKAIADAAEKERREKQKIEEEKERAIAAAEEKARLENERLVSALEEKYKTYIDRGDSAINEQDYDAAKIAFNEALKVKENELYPKKRIADTETLKLKDDQNKNELAKKYAKGVTEEIVTENNIKVTRRIVVTGNKGVLYTKRETNFGSVFYFKDGVAISEKEFTRDTSVKK
ncbi:MAG: carboxypeptidase regulatory-like domain-containing protein [Bacteroidota bacterium]